MSRLSKVNFCYIYLFLANFLHIKTWNWGQGEIGNVGKVREVSNCISFIT